MKKILLFICVAAAFASCDVNASKGLSRDVTCEISLDPANTYIAGQPVKFNISGQTDNIVFYSGEVGHEYKYHERYVVSKEEVESAKLTIKYKGQYGLAGGLHVYLSDKFPGLSGKDFTADTTVLKNMERAMDPTTKDIPDWKQLEYKEGGSNVQTQQEYDLIDYLDHCAIAFHYSPTLSTSAQRTYYLFGTITIELKGLPASSKKFTLCEWTPIMINPEYSDPNNKYLKPQDPYTKTGNPGFNFSKGTLGDIVIYGCNGSAKVPYAHDGWCICKPMALNAVAPDQGTVVKNIQNDLKDYEYVFANPGTYTVTIVGINNTVANYSKHVHEFTVTIKEKPTE